MPFLFSGDESGNLNFAFSQGGTWYFIVALVGFDQPDEIRQRIEKFKHERGLVGREFSFHEITSQRLKERLLRFLATLRFTAWVLVVRKDTLAVPYRAMQRNTLYAFLVSEAIRQIPLEQRNNSNLILDEFDRSGKVLLELGRVLKAQEIVRGFKKIAAKRSSSEPLIQVADLIAGAVFQRFAKGDERFLQLIAEKVTVVEFPTKEKPPS